MLRPKSVVCQFRVAAVVAPLALVLSMSISHQAMAACTGVAGGTIVCTDESTIPFDNVVDFSTTGTAAADGNFAVKVQATAGNEGEAEVENSKNVSATLNTLNATNSLFRIYGMKSADTYGLEEWNLDNSGTISAFHKGLGETAGVFVAGDAEAWNINNSGTIAVGRGALTAITSNATSGAITATDSFGNTGTLGIAGAIYNNEEEIRDHNVVNDGTISATGAYTAGIFTRSNSFELVNNGTISGHQSGVTHGTAAAIVTWDGRLLKHLPDGDVANCNSPNVCTGREAGFGKSFIENNGAIDGNVIITGLNGLQVMGRIGTGADPNTLNGANGAVPNANVQGGMVDRRDSEIENNGTIIGNIYYGNGAHVLNNTEEGEIEGNIIVDMRRVTNYLDAGNYGDTAARQINGNPYSVYVAGRPAAFGEEEGGDDDDDEAEGAAPEIYESDPGLTYGAAMANAVEKLVEDNPDRHFTFENAGKYEGDLSILTVNNTYTNAALLAAAVPTVTITPQTVDLKPHITGSGAGSTFEAPSEGSGYIDGRLFIGNGTMAGWTVTPTTSTISADGAGGTTKTTVTPIIDHVVRSGEWFLVAEELFGNSLPGIEGDTVLVSWEIDKNSGGALVVGSTVADAATVAGLSAPGVATLNALMQGGNADTNALGGALQSLTKAEDVRKAGEQLKPETNFATQQAAWTLSFLTGNSIDDRLNGVGATGASGPGFAQAAGLGMTQTASASPAPEGRMSLGLGTNDGRMNIGANDGRMDAGIYDEDPDLRQRGYSSGMWGQAFGAGLSQDERANVADYSTNIYGALAGVDNWIDDRTRLGIAGGYGNTSINADDADTTKNTTDIDSYLGMIYGAYKDSGWYLSTRAGYSWHDYTTKRVVTVPVSATALGSHSGNQYMASAEIGSPLHYYGGAFTPVASLTWNRLEQDGYQESSVVGLNVASQENDSLQSGLGAKALIPVAPGTLLEGRAIWYHEFEDTNQQVTSAFGGGANFTAAGPSVGRDTAAMGVGMFAYAGTGVSVQLNYDALLRQDFMGHTGSGRVKVEF